MSKTQEIDVLNFDEVNVLGQLLDSTWGRSSTIASPTFSMKGKLSDGKLLLTYTTYATFASNVAMSGQVPRLIDEGKKVTSQFVKQLKTDFKSEAGKSLTLTPESDSHSLEVISLQPHISPKRTVAFRYLTILTVG